MGKERDNLESANNTKNSVITAIILIALKEVAKLIQNGIDNKKLSEIDSKIASIEKKRWPKSKKDKEQMEELKKRRGEIWGRK